jgi:hypothetical protein
MKLVSGNKGRAIQGKLGRNTVNVIFLIKISFLFITRCELSVL